MKSMRGGKKVPLKPTPTRPRDCGQGCPKVKKVLVVRRTGGEVGWDEGRDVWYHEAMAEASRLQAERMDAEDPLFILYTSGSTGKAEGRAAHHRRLPAGRR
jgi:acetyl-CoA synthetase